MKYLKRLPIYMVVVLLVCLWSLRAEAGTIYDSPYVEFAPDGGAWTTCLGDTHNYYYENGYCVENGIVSELRETETGEHYFDYARVGSVPVGRWVVMHEKAYCIHDNYINSLEYHGIDFATGYCGSEYTQGWIGYCADCNQAIANILIYMCEAAAKSIDYMETDTDYYYLCPHCNNLEQGSTINSHLCKGISWNQYKVRYMVNTSNPHTFSMPYESYHMYNNAEEYEGQTVVPNIKLYKMNITVPGYEFVGWNTMADGSGTWYADEAEIFNLTEYDWKQDERGVVCLYAQWRRSKSTLEIDPAGGTYLGEGGIKSIEQYGYTSYEIDMEELKAPAGAVLSFEVNGGEALEPIISNLHFEQWIFSSPFNGRLLENIYWFFGKNETVDRITADFMPDAIILPEPQRENFAFGGWYYDAEFKNPAGKEGDEIIIKTDTELYAQWVELTLSSVENYTANDGKGAVDLSWSQPDTSQKTYRIYQYEARDEGDVPDWYLDDWMLIDLAGDEGNLQGVFDRLEYTGAVEQYLISDTGFYTLTAAGAQGANYGVYTGGFGGEVQGTFWLNAGDVLSITVGGQNGYNGGGKGTAYGNGGGCTIVTSKEQGTLLIAGGGGGADNGQNGGAGGETNVGNLLTGGGDEADSVTGTVDCFVSGGDGMAGGGAGYQGGKAGTRHIHEDNCYTLENSSAGGTFYKEAAYESSTTHSWNLAADNDSVTFKAHSMAESSTYELQIGSASNVFYTPGEGTLKFNIVFEDWGDGYVGEATRWLEVYSDTGTLLLSQDLTGLAGEETFESSVLCRECQVFYNKYYKEISSNDVFSGTMSYNTRQMHYCEAGYSIANGRWCAEMNVSLPITDEVDGIYIRLQYSCDGNSGMGSEFNVIVQDVEYSYTYLSCVKEETSTPAYGGSNFINEPVCSAYRYGQGRNEGDGFFTVQSELIGFSNAMSADGVSAPDMAAPDKVDRTSAFSEAVAGENGKVVNIGWSVPQDRGTKYYFVVESYKRQTGEKLCISNITVNTLVSGVKGFYYLVNTASSDTVSVFNGTFITSPKVQVVLCETAQYLHIAPVDVAGNLGETITIRIGSLEPAEPSDVITEWPVYTDRMIAQGEGIYKGDTANTYFVRCDGVTPLELSFRSYIEGNANLQYQITHSVFESRIEGEEEARNIVITPIHGIVDGEITTSGSGLTVITDGMSMLKPYMYTQTVRSNFNRDLTVKSQYLIGEEADEKMIRVTPVAAVETDKLSVYSDYADDLRNCIYLIGDCCAPEITGTDLLETMEFVNRGEGEFVLELVATDAVSGLAKFRAEIYNGTNGGRKNYVADENGCINIVLDSGASVLAGEFVITLEAVDHVGNSSVKSYRITEFSLEAGVERILAPHDPVFKRGESGLLTVKTWGYAERVEVQFPDCLERADEIYVYEPACYQTMEQIQFMVPLDVESDGRYEVVVRAYKGEEMLEEVQEIWVYGTVLDELRTRLR